jgi:hypothetical protein
MATDTNRKNCLKGGNLDSEKTKYLVIMKLVTTPRKKEMEKEIV